MDEEKKRNDKKQENKERNHTARMNTSEEARKMEDGRNGEMLKVDGNIRNNNNNNETHDETPQANQHRARRQKNEGEMSDEP